MSKTGYFKSEAQKLKMYELLAQGKIKKETIESWEKMTPKDKPLPSKLNKPKKIKTIKKIK